MEAQTQAQEAPTLSDAKIAQLRKQPIIENNIFRSEDGKWLVHKTTITDIKPVSYFEKMLNPVQN